MEIIKDEKIKKIIEKLRGCIRLTRYNGKVYLVGEAVTNSILDEPIKNLEIVVDSENGGNILANIFAAKEKCFGLGKNPLMSTKEGTAKVWLTNDLELKNITITFVEPHKCKYNSLYKCYGTLEEDSKRRELTINSLYWNITDEKIHTFNCGINDMTTQTLRTMEPDVVFMEEPIKMLQVIRYSAELGWGIEKNTWLSIIRNSHFIKTETQEKVSNEFAKILVSNNASYGIRKLKYCGLLKWIVPDVQDLNMAYESRKPMVTAFDHTMRVLDEVQPNIESRLAALFHDIGSVVTEGYKKNMSKDMFSAEIARGDIEDMKFSTDIAKAVETAIRYHRVFGIYSDGVMPPDKKIRKFVSLCGENLGVTMDLMNANNLHCTYGKKKRQAFDILNRIEELEEIEEEKNVKLPVSGSDIIKHLKLKKGGPIVGIVLEKIKEAFFENPNMTKEECLELAVNECKVLAV